MSGTALLSSDNINNIFSHIENEIKMQTNGFMISSIPKYKNSFPTMAKIIYDKCHANNDLASFNKKLITSSVQLFLKKIRESGLLANNKTTHRPPTLPLKDMTPFTINDYIDNSNVIYSNINELERMEKNNPMNYLNQYNQQREQDLKQLSTDIISINDLKNPNIAHKSNDVYINNLMEQKQNEIAKYIVNDDTIKSANIDLPALQKESQPKYAEKVHYFTVNSGDREWDILAENRYNFQVKFNQKYDPNNRQAGTQISHLFKNIISVELVMAIMPLETCIEPFDTRLYFNISKFPYLLLKIDELDRVFYGTNNENEAAFSMLIYDKMFSTDILSTGYAVNPSATSNGIVNSYPAVNYSNEFKRGYIKYQPVYFEKKIFYNNPLASLNRMSIHITDHRGYSFNSQSDVLTIESIEFTNNLNSLTTTDYEIDPQYGFPYTNYSGATKMIAITPTANFSNRLFRIGDRIIIRNHTRSAATNSTALTLFLNREEGHIIINLQKEVNTATGNKSFVSILYIAPPAIMNTDNSGISGYYDSNVGSTDVGGVLLNNDLQCNLMFRIITRDTDTPYLTKPINT